MLGHRVPEAIDRVRGEINLVPESPTVYERATAKENLDLFCALYGVPRSRGDEALERVRLTHAAKRKVKTFSTGMKQRLLLARSLLNAPRVLFMDEPTRGLDPQSARELHTLIEQLAAGGTTVFLTTHDMHEADRLCDRVAFLADGRIVALDTPRALKLALGGAPEVDVVLDDGSGEHLRLASDGGGGDGARLLELVRARSRAHAALLRADARRRLHRAGGPLARRRAARPRRAAPMSARRITAILLKDLREAVRDGRILVLLLLPIGLAVFYNATTSDGDERPETTVVVVDQAGTGLAARAARGDLGAASTCTIRSARDAAQARRDRRCRRRGVRGRLAGRPRRRPSRREPRSCCPRTPRRPRCRSWRSSTTPSRPRRGARRRATCPCAGCRSPHRTASRATSSTSRRSSSSSA